ncbi:hypothetical protein L3Q82_005597 [Scortum barcoo]|uniref:Uncharacterized protein n=1 Tax=Scortum barcoo TaxID=214431 RepID=A0ACB8V6I1_9TELE|nr:hypothetical protein L3Q82_005597 [Scortum barcoo]
MFRRVKKRKKQAGKLVVKRQKDRLTVSVSLRPPLRGSLPTKTTAGQQRLCVRVSACVRGSPCVCLPAAVAGRPAGIQAECRCVGEMKDPSLNMKVSTELILGGQMSSEEDPFADYLWMEHEEEFNRQVEEELWEEEFIDRCMEELLEEEEQWEWFIPARDLPQLQDQISLLVLDSDVHADADFDIVV